MRKVLIFTLGLVLLSTTGAFADTYYDLSTAPPAAPGYDVAVPGTIVIPNTSTFSYWEIIDQAPTGTGTFEPFLRLQGKNDSPFPPMETGLNTNYGTPRDPVGSHQVPYDDVSSIWTHALTFSQLATVTIPPAVGNPAIPAGTYYSFTLDFNEPGSATRFLSAETFTIYKGTNPLINSITDPNLTKLYTGILPASHVLMDYTLASSGSGEADIQVFVPVAAFADAAPGDYLYLFNQLGGAGTVDGKDFSWTDRFEEWRALLGTPTVVPIPAAAWLLGSGLVGLIGLKRRIGKNV